MDTQYRFTRTGAEWAITTLAGEAWHRLDGLVSTHAGGLVACVQLFGADALLTEAVRAAWSAWWQGQVT